MAFTLRGAAGTPAETGPGAAPPAAPTAAPAAAPAPAPPAVLPAAPAPPPPSAAPALAAGPMIGANDMRATALWVQTTAPAAVQIAYWPKDAPAQREVTATVQTRAEDACTATLVADRVQPGVFYAYQVLLDGQPVALPYPAEFATLPDWRARGGPPDFSVAFAWGDFVFDPVIDPPQYRPSPDLFTILTVLQSRRPAALVWLGGGVWLREADWGSRAGLLRRYAHTRALPEMQPLLATIPQYAVIGATDYGPPGADRYLTNQRDVREAFRLFWPNPTYGAAQLEGFMTSFRCGDAEFFLLDDRSQRDLSDVNGLNRKILGAEQISWLLAALRRSPATFKVVCMSTPVLNNVPSPEHLSGASSERDRLLGLLRDPSLRGVLFVTGGKAYGELSRVARSQPYDLFDLTVGPLFTRPAETINEPNLLRVAESAKNERQFALLTFAGPANQRSVTLSLVDALGQTLFTTTLSAAQLGYGQR